MSSIHEVIPWAGRANYAAGSSLAQGVAEHRTRVNGIGPGAIRAAINRPAWQRSGAERRLVELIAYGRIGDADDIATAAVWLASDASDSVIGTTLFVDGGMALCPGFRGNG